MKTQLLCTFTKQEKLNETIDIIVSCNKILYDKIYVFTDVNDPNQLFAHTMLNSMKTFKNQQ